MNIILRKGRRQDIPAVLKLIKELAEFENAADEVSNTIEDMIHDGFGENPCYRLLVAEADAAICGIAIFFIKYSTWKGKGIYLDDIVVTESMRGKGIGKMLFDKVVEYAVAENAKQLHWQVLDWNEPAINFYKKYAASIDATWLDCKLNEKQLKALNQSVD